MDEKYYPKEDIKDKLNPMNFLNKKEKPGFKKFIDL